MSKSDIRYTVSRCRSDDTLFGPIHGGCDVNGSPCYETLCDQRIDDHWWIIGDKDITSITCKKCLAALMSNVAVTGPRLRGSGGQQGSTAQPPSCED